MKKVSTEILAAESLTMTDAEICLKYGMDRTTLYRRRKTAAFILAFRQVKEQAYTGVLTQAQTAAKTAIATLQEIAADKEAAPAARVTAAKAILEAAAKAFETENILTRLEDLEAAGAENDQENYS